MPNANPVIDDNVLGRCLNDVKSTGLTEGSTPSSLTICSVQSLERARMSQSFPDWTELLILKRKTELLMVALFRQRVIVAKADYANRASLRVHMFNRNVSLSEHSIAYVAYVLRSL